MGRLGATGLNASFGLIRNFWRDMWTFTTLAKHAKGGPVSAATGVGKNVVTQISDIAHNFGFKGIPQSSDVQKFRALGGEMSVQVLQDKQGQKYLRGTVLANSGKRFTMHTLAHPVDAMKHLFSLTEAGTRVGEFGAALKAGEKKWGKGSKDAAFYALYMGQDVTTNFTRHGRIAKKVNQGIMFFNAGIQGPDKIYRTIKARPMRTIGTAIGALTVPAVYLWWRNKDKEWYKELPAHEKYGYQHFEVPGDPNTIVRVPVPFELGHIFQSIPVAHLDALYKSDPNEVKKMFGKTLEDINPVDIPAVARPLWDLASNKDFAGRPVVPRRVEGKLAEDQYKRHTTELMKFIGKTIKMSPAQIEHLVDSYTGGAYKRTARALEKPKGEQVKSDIPVVGTLFLRDPYAPKDSIEGFYREKERLGRLFQSKKITPEQDRRRRRYNYISTTRLSLLWQKLEKAETMAERERIYKIIGEQVKLANK
jgi:hypothetical protein